MAEELLIGPSRARVKLRSPWAVALLPFITLGIYHLVWWYKINKELKAYGGGSLRVMLIRQQIRQTLLQFPTVREVRIAIEGQTEGALEP